MGRNAPSYFDMNKSDIFGENGSKGSLAEQLLIAYYKRMGYAVEDLTADTTKTFEWENRGIDFRILKKGWRDWITCDSKANFTQDCTSDGRLYNTTFLEIEKYNRRGQWVPGWFCASEATRIKHVNVDTNMVAYYDLKQMRVEVIKRGLKINTTCKTSKLIKIDIDSFSDIIRIITI